MSVRVKVLVRIDIAMIVHWIVIGLVLLLT